MLDKIKTSFSISDLQELTGISAHTIRMWERRFNLLDPLRTESNIRRYTNEHLKKLLNISLMLQAGYKISELATYTEPQLNLAVNSRLSPNDDYDQAMGEFKIAMLNYDSRLFEDTYNRLLRSMSFYDLFLKVLIPFLSRIGTLWQTNSITVGHEHYISNLLRQKLFFQIEHLPKPRSNTHGRHFLFLPLNELHELGILFVYYTLLMNGRDTVYLGADVGIDSLHPIPESRRRVFVSYFTMAPADTELDGYFTDFRQTVLKPDDEFLVTGERVKGYEKNKSWKNIEIYPNLKDLLNKIKV